MSMGGGLLRVRLSQVSVRKFSNFSILHSEPLHVFSKTPYAIHMDGEAI